MGKLIYCLEYCLTFSNLISGAFVITLEKDWFSKINDASKIPLYAFVSSSLAFATVYILIDVFEAIIECVHFDTCKRPKSSYNPLIVTNLMHLVLLIFTLSLGLVFGTIFSFTDVERFWKSIWHLFYAAHVIERRYCAPIGTMIGMTGGLIFMAIRCEEVDNIEKKYQKEGQKKKFRF